MDFIAHAGRCDVFIFDDNAAKAVVFFVQASEFVRVLFCASDVCALAVFQLFVGEGRQGDGLCVLLQQNFFVWWWLRHVLIDVRG